MKHRVKVNVYRNDYIPAFGAWGPKSGDILLNLEAIFGPLVDEDGTPVEMSVEERKRNLVETLMHEFGHALEQEPGLKWNEDFLHRVTEAWTRRRETKFKAPKKAARGAKKGAHA